MNCLETLYNNMYINLSPICKRIPYNLVKEVERLFQVLVLSHGNLSAGMKDTLDLFEIDRQRCQFLQAYVGDENPRDYIKEFAGSDVEHKIILTDLKSGSLTRIAIEEGVLDQSDVTLISGFNLAMLIGILTQTEMSEAILQEVLEFSRMDIELLKNMDEEEEDAFF